MKRLLSATSLVLTTGLALAAGPDSGTSTVGDLEITGGQFLMLIGGFAAVGVAVWIVIKLMSK